MPVGDLPAYPSEDAVLSGVTVEMLKVLFPAAVAEITQRAAEQRNAALWSGKAAASDIAAGLALGKAVAATLIARAGADGMRNAVGNAAQWQALADRDRKSTRLNSRHLVISHAVFCLKKKTRRPLLQGPARKSRWHH